MSAVQKETESLARAEAELAVAQQVIADAQAKFVETGEGVKDIRAAKDRAELAELHVERAKLLLARAEAAATVAAKEERRKKWAQDKAAIETMVAKDAPLVDAEAKLLLQLVDLRIARRNLRAEAYARVQEWLPFYLEFSPPFEVSELCAKDVASGSVSQLEALKWSNSVAYAADPWINFSGTPPTLPVIEAARSTAKLIEQPGKADPRSALLDRVLPAPIDYQLPSPPKVNGVYLEWIPWSDVPRFFEEKKGLLGLLK
jgi:hypothetical protein